MDPDIFCQLSRTDGSTLEVWLPAKQVEVMTDIDNPDRMKIFEDLGVVSIEVADSRDEASDR